jgi:hypothetical protein
MNVCEGPNNERNRLWKKNCQEVRDIFFITKGKKMKDVLTPEERYKAYRTNWLRY